MRAGPDVALLARDDVAIGFRIDVVLGGLGRRVLALDVPATGLTFDATAERVVPEQISYTLPLEWVPTDPHDAASGFGQRSHVWAIQEIDGQRFETEIGWFLHDNEWEETGHGVTVRAYGLMQILEENPLIWPSSPPKGATLLSELQRLATGIPVRLDGVADTAIPTSLQWERSRPEAIRDLCEAQGLHFAVRPDGYLHVWPRRTARIVDATYTVEDLLLSAPKVGQGRKPNYYTAVGEKTEGSGDDAKTTRWSTTATATTAPFDQASYGIVREIIQVDSAKSATAVRAAANRALQDSLIVTEKRSLEIAFDPRIELGDVIALVPQDVKGTKEYLVGRVCAYSMPFSREAKMRVDIEVLQW